jgi:hypothetical protein
VSAQNFHYTTPRAFLSIVISHKTFLLFFPQFVHFATCNLRSICYNKYCQEGEASANWVKANPQFAVKAKKKEKENAENLLTNPTKCGIIKMSSREEQKK